MWSRRARGWCGHQHQAHQGSRRPARHLSLPTIAFSNRVAQLRALNGRICYSPCSNHRQTTVSERYAPLVRHVFAQSRTPEHNVKEVKVRTRLGCMSTHFTLHAQVGTRRCGAGQARANQITGPQQRARGHQEGARQKQSKDDTRGDAWKKLRGIDRRLPHKL